MEVGGHRDVMTKVLGRKRGKGKEEKSEVSHMKVEEEREEWGKCMCRHIFKKNPSHTKYNKKDIFLLKRKQTKNEKKRNRRKKE